MTFDPVKRIVVFHIEITVYVCILVPKDCRTSYTIVLWYCYEPKVAVIDWVRVKRGNGMTEAEKRKRNGGSGKEGKTRKKG